MSSDVYLKSEKGPLKISNEELNTKLSNDFNIIKIFTIDSEYVTDFEIQPKNLKNPEGLVYTFHIQPEGYLWHPAPGRTKESIELGVDVLELVSSLLDLEIDYP